MQIRKGAYLGLVDDRAVVSDPDLETVVREVVERVLEGERELLSILTGEGAPKLDGLVAAAADRAAEPVEQRAARLVAHAPGDVVPARLHEVAGESGRDFHCS